MLSLLHLPARYRLFRRIRNDDKKLVEVSLVDGHIGAATTTHLAGALQLNSSVTTLWLTGNDFGDGGATALAQTFRTNNKIRHAILGVNDVGPKGAEALAVALAGENTSLEVLCLGSNRLGDEGVSAIAESLVSNRSLKELWLRDNRFGVVGASKLADALQKNRTLRELWIGGNSVGNEGASAIAALLRCRDSALAVLDLSNNSIGTVGAFALADALRTNHKIIKLDLVGNFIKDDNLLEKNSRLVEINKKAGDAMEAEKLKIAEFASQNMGAGFHASQEVPLHATTKGGLSSTAMMSQVEPELKSFGLLAA